MSDEKNVNEVNQELLKEGYGVKSKYKNFGYKPKKTNSQNQPTSETKPAGGESGVD